MTYCDVSVGVADDLLDVTSAGADERTDRRIGHHDHDVITRRLLLLLLVMQRHRAATTAAAAVTARVVVTVATQ